MITSRARKRPRCGRIVRRTGDHGSGLALVGPARSGLCPGQSPPWRRIYGRRPSTMNTVTSAARSATPRMLPPMVFHHQAAGKTRSRTSLRQPRALIIPRYLNQLLPLFDRRAGPRTPRSLLSPGAQRLGQSRDLFLTVSLIAHWVCRVDVLCSCDNCFPSITNSPPSSRHRPRSAETRARPASVRSQAQRRDGPSGSAGWAAR